MRSPGRFMATASRLVGLYRRYRETGDPSVRQKVIQGWIDAQAYRWFTFDTVTRMVAGESIGAESSLNKIFWSEMDLELHETAIELLGAAAEFEVGAEEAVDRGAWMKGYQFALAGPIYAGTNEIQRNIAAERVLGLPRR